MEPANLFSTYLKLKPNATIEHLPVDDQFWTRLGSGEWGNFHNEYLVSCTRYETDWNQWEMHPCGDELVILLSGSVRFILEMAGHPTPIDLNQACRFVRVPMGTWHTAKVQAPSTLLFITAGEGTQHRPLKAS